MVASFGNVRRTMQDMRQTLAPSLHNEAVTDYVELVLAEALNNVVEHSGCAESGELIHLEIMLDDRDVRCQIRDCGAPWPELRNPGRFPDPLEGDAPEGGFGWPLIHTLTRELRYERVLGENRLTLVLPRQVQ